MVDRKRHGSLALALARGAASQAEGREFEPRHPRRSCETNHLQSSGGGSSAQLKGVTAGGYCSRFPGGRRRLSRASTLRGNEGTSEFTRTAAAPRAASMTSPLATSLWKSALCAMAAAIRRPQKPHAVTSLHPDSVPRRLDSSRRQGFSDESTTVEGSMVRRVAGELATHSAASRSTLRL
jgi:hypothetical protein